MSSRVTAVMLAATVLVAGCGGGGGTTHSVAGTAGSPSTTAGSTIASGTTAGTTSTVARPKPPPPSYPRVLASALGTGTTSGFVPAVRWGDHTAGWIDRTPGGVGLLELDQRYVTLRLHSGTIDAGTLGWRYGPLVTGGERKRLVAAFNGGFKLITDAGGFMSYGRVAVPLREGLGSIVSYANGRTNVGSWHVELPSAGQKVVSVRQNLNLLIDHGASASDVGCDSCWGATLGGVSTPARSALGITANGRLVWAGGEHLTVAALASALLGAHVVRAVELDINPEWVAAYVYGHRGGHGPLAPVPVAPGQPGVPGQFLAPYSRDFFTIVAR